MNGTVCKAALLAITQGLKERAAWVLKKAGEMVMPSKDDLRGAANSLARLQITYRIPIGSFMAGRILDAPSSASKGHLLHLRSLVHKAFI